MVRTCDSTLACGWGRVEYGVLVDGRGWLEVSCSLCMYGGLMSLFVDLAEAARGKVWAEWHLPAFASEIYGSASLSEGCCLAFVGHFLKDPFVCGSFSESFEVRRRILTTQHEYLCWREASTPTSDVWLSAEFGLGKVCAYKEGSFSKGNVPIDFIREAGKYQIALYGAKVGHAWGLMGKGGPVGIPSNCLFLEPSRGMVGFNDRSSTRKFMIDWWYHCYRAEGLNDFRVSLFGGL